MDYTHHIRVDCLASPFDWVSLDPSCSREISRYVDQELYNLETIAEILNAQEAG